MACANTTNRHATAAQNPDTCVRLDAISIKPVHRMLHSLNVTSCMLWQKAGDSSSAQVPATVSYTSVHEPKLKVCMNDARQVKVTARRYICIKMAF